MTDVVFHRELTAEDAAYARAVLKAYAEQQKKADLEAKAEAARERVENAPAILAARKAKWAKAAELHASGLTYREVGAFFGLSASSGRDFVLSHNRLLRRAAYLNRTAA